MQIERNNIISFSLILVNSVIIIMWLTHFARQKDENFVVLCKLSKWIKYTYTINIFKAVVVVSEKSTKWITFVFFAMIKSGVI